MISTATRTQRSRAVTPWRHTAPTSEPGGSVRPVAVSVSVASIAFLVAGVIWPQAADALIRMLFATLAVGFVTAMAHRALRPVRSLHDVHSPFGREATQQAPALAPRALRKFITELRAAEAAGPARRSPIPELTRLTVRREASRRLTQNHGLSLDDTAHHARIRSLVSGPTWHLIRPRDPRARPARDRTARDPSVPLSELGRILDDLEAL